MKSKIVKRALAYMLCMALVLSTGSPMTAAGEEVTSQTDTQTTEKVLICGQEEVAPHQHGDGCYEVDEAGNVKTDESGNPIVICGVEETEGHTHTDACYQEVAIATQVEEPVVEETVTEETETTEVVEEETVAEPEVVEDVQEELKSLNYEDEEVTVTVSELSVGAIPEGATLKVVPILADNGTTAEQYKEVEKQIQNKAEENETEIQGFLAYDITFVDVNGKEVEPNSEVKVTMEYKEPALPEVENSMETEDTEVSILHLEEDEEGNVKEVIDMDEVGQLDDIKTTEMKQVEKVEVKTDSFSVYTIVWTHANRIFELKFECIDEQENPLEPSSYEAELEGSDKRALDVIAPKIDNYEILKWNIKNQDGEWIEFKRLRIEKVTQGSSSDGYKLQYSAVDNGDDWHDTGHVVKKSGENCEVRVQFIYKKIEIPQYVYVKKIDAENEVGIEGALFTLTNTETEKVYGDVSDSQGDMVFFVPPGTYTLKEKKEPNGYIQKEDEWTIQVNENGEVTWENQIIDEQHPLEIDNEEDKNPFPGVIGDDIRVDKTAQVSNYDDRIYDIDLYLSHNAKVDKPISVVLTLDVSGSMPWFVTEPSGGDTTLSELKQDDAQYEEIKKKNTISSSAQINGVDGWKFTYYYKNEGTAGVDEYKPVCYISDKSAWFFIKSNTDGTISLGDEIKDNDTLYIRGENDQTKLEALYSSIMSFLEKMKSAPEGSQVGLVCFAGNVPTESVVNLGAIGLNSSDNIINQIDSYFKNNIILYGGTNQAAGLKDAQELLVNAKQGNDKYIILFSDGAPDSENVDSSTQEANTIKGSDTILMTAGIFGTLDGNVGYQYMKEWADAEDYAKLATTSDGLRDAFDALFNEINVRANGATVTDYIDPRFYPVDENGDPLPVGSNIGGGTLQIDQNGNWYVEWKDVTIPYAENAQAGWHKTITVRAKEDFMGGNMIPTNTSASQVEYVNTHKNQKYAVAFPQPSVNVKLLTPQLDDKEFVIYLGDTEPSSDDMKKGLGETFKVQKLYDTDEKDTFVPEDIDFNKLSEEQDYTYPGTTDVVGTFEFTYDEESKTLSVTYTSKTVDERNSILSDQGITQPNTDSSIGGTETDKTNASGIGSVRVISGSIVITKTLKEAASENVTFKFDIEKDGKIVETVSITVKQGNYQGSAETITKLARGTYTVTEQLITGYQMESLVSTSETDCYATSTSSSVSFTLGYDEKEADVIKNYTYNEEDGGVLGAVECVNKKATEQWKIIKVSSNNTGYKLGGAHFELLDSNNKTVYTGISSGNTSNLGEVEWFEGGTKICTYQIQPGSYTLKETVAPSGYLLSSEEWQITVNSDGSISINGQTADVDGGISVYKFKNEVLYALPSSGGFGIFVYMISGVVLMMAAALILYKRKSREVL